MSSVGKDVTFLMPRSGGVPVEMLRVHTVVVSMDTFGDPHYLSGQHLACDGAQGAGLGCWRGKPGLLLISLSVLFS